MQERVFLFVSFWALWFFLFVFLFCLEKAPQKAIFLQFIFFPKRPVFKIIIFFLFFPCFPFVFLFQNSIIFLCFLSINPFLEKIFVWFLLSLFLLPFPFLMFASFFETNFSNIPFLKPTLLSFWALYFFFCCFYFCFHGVCVPFCFYVGFVFGMFFFFWFVSCFAFRLWKEHCFPCSSSDFKSCWLKGGFSVSCFVLVCFSCVVCFHFKHFSI